MVYTDLQRPVTARLDKTTCPNPSSPWKPKHNAPLTDTWLMDRGKQGQEELSRTSSAQVHAAK